MQINVVNKSKDGMQLSFTLKGVTPAYANTLRRLMLNKVPTMAIEDIEIRKNNSVLYDEILAHRLGLLPLKTDLKGYSLRKEGDEGNARNQCAFTLKVKGPGMVYASELKSKDPAIKVVFPKTPLVNLLKGQEVALEATAELGVGKTHAKWSPCHVWYTFDPDVKVNNSSKLFAEFKDKFPPEAFDKSGKLDKKAIIEKNLVDACAGVCDDVLSVTYDNTSFLFHVESWGQLDCASIVEEAITCFNDLLSEMEENVKAL